MSVKKNQQILRNQQVSQILVMLASFNNISGENLGDIITVNFFYVIERRRILRNAISTHGLSETFR